MLCERFTTSKLREFSDLLSIGTYGFRGEALASVSHVAKLSVTTKTDGCACAFRADYLDGKLTKEPRSCAGVRGTIISVEDIFYNMGIRRNALRSASEEYNRISEVVARYAIHNANVGFSLKRQGETCGSLDVKTLPGSTPSQNIAIAYGNKFSEELVKVNLSDTSLGLKINGLVTNPNFSVRKFRFILFVNHRLVESSPMKRAVELLFASYVPKTSHPFVYLSVEVPADQIDVNVHPTKQEVRLLHEGAIIERLTEVLENELLAFNQSRTFPLNTLAGPSISRQQTESVKDAGQPTEKKRLYDHELVRTDNREQKLDNFFPSNSCGQSASSHRTAAVPQGPKEKVETATTRVCSRACGKEDLIEEAEKVKEKILPVS